MGIAFANRIQPLTPWYRSNRHGSGSGFTIVYDCPVMTLLRLSLPELLAAYPVERPGHYRRGRCQVSVPILVIRVTQKEVWTKDGLSMSFLTFEDETSLYETAIFPGVYERYNHLLFDQFSLLVHGKACEERGALSLEAENVGSLII
jgi:hypothetical protein